MNLSLLRAAIGAGLVLAVFGAASAQDVVSYVDRKAKKEIDLDCEIVSESPGGLKVKVGKGKDVAEQQVPVDDITRVQYRNKEVARAEYRRPFNKEAAALKETDSKRRIKGLREALEGFADLEKKLDTVRPARRYLRYKIAVTNVRLAQEAPDDPKKLESALAALTTFKNENKGGWQVTPALKLLAQIHEERGDAEEARKAYEDLAELPDVPAELKRQSQVLVGRLLSRGGKYREAETRLSRLLQELSQGDPQYPFVRAYLIEAKVGQNKVDDALKELRGVIATSTDGRLRGLAYNLLGDYFLKKGQQEDAFWAYLRVDVQYNDSPEEQAKALYHLVTLFDKVKKDPIRGKACLARLMAAGFNNTRYQKLAEKTFKDAEK